MARIRTVKPELFRHEGLYEAEVATGLPIRLAYIGLFTSCDREGRFKWKPRALKLDALPYDDVDFSRVLDALLTHGFIVKYEFMGEEFGCIPSWKHHQVINNRETESSLPSPEESTACTRQPRVNDASTTPLVQVKGEGKGREGKGKEGESNQESRKRSPPVPKPEDVDQQTWDDWLALRKAKKAPVTQTVLNQAKTEASKAGMTLNDFFTVWCARGSQGLQADWIKPHEKAQSQALSFAQQDELARRARWKEMTGEDWPSNDRAMDYIDVDTVRIAP